MSDPQVLTLTLDMLTPLFTDGQSVKASRDLKPSQFSGLRASADGTYLLGDCQGRGGPPYRVKADLSGGQGRFDCDCDSMKYPCKHALGLLLQRVNQPEAFAVFEPSPADRQRLQQSAQARPLSVKPPEPKPDPTTEGEAMLRAVFDEPDGDDAPRLIYADWLEEHGGPDGAPRAQLIRLQCQAARTPPGPEAEVLERRIGKLIDQHRTRWMADVPPHLRGKVLFVRGFLGCLEMPPSYLLKHGPGLVERFPITEVRLSTAPDAKEASKLAVSPLWSRVTTLTLAHGVSERRALELLLTSPYLKALRYLQLWPGEGGEGASLPHVQHLVRSEALGRLRRLDLSGNSLKAPSLAALLAGDLSELRELVLNANPLGNDGLAALPGWEAPAGLEALSLADCDAGPRGVEALLTAPWLGQLKRLDLSGNRLTAAGAEALAGCAALEGLRELGLAGTHLPEAAQRAVRERFGGRARLG